MLRMIPVHTVYSLVRSTEELSRVEQTIALWEAEHDYVISSERSRERIAANRDMDLKTIHNLTVERSHLTTQINELSSKCLELEHAIQELKGGTLTNEQRSASSFPSSSSPSSCSREYLESALTDAKSQLQLQSQEKVYLQRELTDLQITQKNLKNELVDLQSQLNKQTAAAQQARHELEKSRAQFNNQKSVLESTNDTLKNRIASLTPTRLNNATPRRSSMIPQSALTRSLYRAPTLHLQSLLGISADNASSPLSSKNVTSTPVHRLTSNGASAATVIRGGPITTAAASVYTYSILKGVKRRGLDKKDLDKENIVTENEEFQKKLRDQANSGSMRSSSSSSPSISSVRRLRKPRASLLNETSFAATIKGTNQKVCLFDDDSELFDDDRPLGHLTEPLNGDDNGDAKVLDSDARTAKSAATRIVSRPRKRKLKTTVTTKDIFDENDPDNPGSKFKRKATTASAKSASAAGPVTAVTRLKNEPLRKISPLRTKNEGIRSAFKF